MVQDRPPAYCAIWKDGRILSDGCMDRQLYRRTDQKGSCTPWTWLCRYAWGAGDDGEKLLVYFFSKHEIFGWNISCWLFLSKTFLDQKKMIEKHFLAETFLANNLLSDFFWENYSAKKFRQKNHWSEKKQTVNVFCRFFSTGHICRAKNSTEHISGQNIFSKQNFQLKKIGRKNSAGKFSATKFSLRFGWNFCGWTKFGFFFRDRRHRQGHSRIDEAAAYGVHLSSSSFPVGLVLRSLRILQYELQQVWWWRRQLQAVLQEATRHLMPAKHFTTQKLLSKGFCPNFLVLWACLLIC